MLRYLSDYKRESVLAPLFKMLEATFDLFVPLVMADIVNVGITAHDFHYILVRCGILLLLAVEDRQVRIEVGNGLEGALPDPKTGRILDQYATPDFRNDDFSAGMRKAYRALINEVYIEYGLEPLDEDYVPVSPEEDTTDDGDALGAVGTIVLLIIVFALVFGRRHYRGGPPFIFFGGHGGGFGGGSGGSFGGGGAGSRW